MIEALDKLYQMLYIVYTNFGSLVTGRAAGNGNYSKSGRLLKKRLNVHRKLLFYCGEPIKKTNEHISRGTFGVRACDRIT